MPLDIEHRLYSHHKILGLIFMIGFMVTTLYLLTQPIRMPVLEHFKRYQQRIYNDMSDERRAFKIQLRPLLKCHDQRLITELLQHGNYWLLKNIIRGRLSIDMGCSETITFTTIGDYTYMGNLEELVTRWLGPISFALFAPGHDFNATMNAIQYARHCLPVSPLIRDYVSFHIYMPNDHMPYGQVPRTEKEALAWPYDCMPMFAPYDHVNRSQMYSSEKDLNYPINVGRNIARKSANTYFVFACDIELYPSMGFIDKFLRMALNNVSSVLGGQRPRVFAVPVFELERNALVPDNKDQLMTMLQMKMAIPLHEQSCRHCCLVPDQDRWLQANDSDKFEVVSVAKRYNNFPFWEPFFVSDNREPEFDERFSWDSRSDKRLQSYAMCLLDYEYHILHPAFLTHSPDINPFAPLDERVDKVAEAAMKEYWTLYGNNIKCKV